MLIKGAIGAPSDEVMLLPDLAGNKACRLSALRVIRTLLSQSALRSLIASL